MIALHEWNKPEEKQLAIKCAVAIREATAGHLVDVWEAEEALDEAMAPPPEEIIRAILGAMLSTLRAKPTEGAAIYVDALVWELTEPATGREFIPYRSGLVILEGPFCSPAVAAAARETWTTQTFPPSVAEFMQRVRKHQMRIETVRAQLASISEASFSAHDVLRRPAIGDGPQSRE